MHCLAHATACIRHYEDSWTGLDPTCIYFPLSRLSSLSFRLNNSKSPRRALRDWLDLHRIRRDGVHATTGCSGPVCLSVLCVQEAFGEQKGWKATTWSKGKTNYWKLT